MRRNARHPCHHGPIYLWWAAGYLSTRLGLFERGEMRVFGKYVVNVALPALLFNAPLATQPGGCLNPVFSRSLCAGFAGGPWPWVCSGRARWRTSPLSAAAIVGMGMSCPNSGFIGYPLVAQLFGASTAGIGLALAMWSKTFCCCRWPWRWPCSIAGGAHAEAAPPVRAALAQSSRQSFAPDDSTESPRFLFR